MIDAATTPGTEPQAAPLSFSRATGLEEAKDFLSRALATGKFPHALLVHGPDGAGQNALLLDLADILLCDAAGARPCGACRPCLQGRAGSNERIHYLLPLESNEGDEDRAAVEGAQLEELTEKIAAFRGDPYGFGLGERARIRIAQSRDIQTKLGFAGAARERQVILIPWAERFQVEAANALLKTLEEPRPGTYFLLSTSNRKAVLQTILSRCTGLPVPPLDDEAFAAAVRARKAWWDGAAPDPLVPFAEGSLGALLRLYREGGDDLLAKAGAFVEAALDPSWRAFSDYLDATPDFDDRESAARLLQFVLRVTRAWHRLRLEADAGPGGLSGALSRLGWPPSLADLFRAFGPCEDLAAFTALVESILSAVQDWCRPRMAALGLRLERDARPVRAPGTPAAAGAPR